MRRRPLSAFLPAAAWSVFASGGCLSGCLLYTDPINRPPSPPQIQRTAGKFRNMPIIFTAHGTDPDGDKLRFDWAQTPVVDADRDCPPTPDSNGMPSLTTSGPTFSVTAADLTPFCVWLRATDPSGATSAPVTLVSAALNAPAVAVLTRQQPSGNQLTTFPLNSLFRFSAAESTDPDGDSTKLARVWNLAAFPDTAHPQFNDHCASSEPADMAACFRADAPGSYQLVLTVDDGAPAPSPAAPESTKTAIVIVAEDAPPCLRADGTDVPARVADPAEAQVFSVTVTDDGDPWPKVDPANDYPRFTWRLRVNGGAWQTATGYDAALDLPGGQLSVGDRAEVRVEVADRVTRSLSSCGDAATCSLVTGCPQRLTWTVDFR